MLLFIILKCGMWGNDVSIIVFGWNQGQKDSINIGKKNNQEFVQIPTAKLKNRISQLAEQYGINFVETEDRLDPLSKSYRIRCEEASIYKVVSAEETSAACTRRRAS